VSDAIRHIVAVDFEFEFGGHAGERPRPVCMVAKDLCTGQEWRRWRGEFGTAPPFPTGADSIIVAYYASAELGCFHALGWPMPARVVDLFVEFRDRTNHVAQRRKLGVKPLSVGLIDALAHFGLDAIGAIEKDEMRALVLRGGPWTGNERGAILNYCASDVAALERLWPAMLPRLDMPRALLRGRYMAAAAAMEHAGVPIDTATLDLLRERWTDIQDDLIAAIDGDYGVFEGRIFKAERWAAYLATNNIPWPRLESGQLDLSDKTFREMAKSFPAVSPMRELRSALAELRLNDLAVGCDGRNRTLLSVFRSGTGRNQPSNAKFIFGPSVWLRGLIRPPPGHGVAYIDWSQQEFGIAAALSGDPAMQDAYRSGDPYLTFAKQSGAVPADSTKQTHGAIRELYKQCVLAVQYGMGAESLALRIGQPTAVARQLLRAHHETYRRFWGWSDAIVNYAMLHGSLHTVFGWHGHIGDDTNPRSLRNFPMQGNGAEMLRLACCLATERGIEVCAPVHDAMLICAPLDRFDADIAAARAAMAEASKVVLTGFELATGAHVTHYPDRFRDPGGRGDVMWQRVMGLIANRKAAAA
jgi:DNA polymerase I